MEPGARSPAWSPAARVESLPDGIRVTLLPQREDRLLRALLLLACLAGWAAGEIHVVSLLLEFAAQVGLAPAGPPHADMGPVSAAFLLLWLVAWTVGGLGVGRALLRLLFSSDVFSVAPTGFVLQQRIGPWKRTRWFFPGEIERLEMQGDEGPLVARQGRRRIPLTDLGTPADRRWLLGLLGEAVGAPGSVALEDAPGKLLPAPAGYDAETLPDGSVRLRYSAEQRFSQVGCVFGLALVMNSFLVGILTVLWRDPFEGEVFMRVLFWILLIPCAYLGLGLAHGFLWSLFVRQEWRLSPNLLEVRHRAPHRAWSERYTEAALALVSRRDDEGDEHFSLEVFAHGKGHSLGGGDLENLRKLAALVTASTGWPLEE